MRALASVLVTIAVLLASSVAAEQRWQCGDGLTVPVQGSRADREAACRDAVAKRDHPGSEITQEQADRLRKRIEQVEKQYDVTIKVDKLDQR